MINKEQEQSNFVQDSKSDEKSIFENHPTVMVNIIWIIVILFLVIIGLITFIMSSAINAADIISAVTNFSTILSIFLSISSIFFAYFTSRDTSAQYSYMNKALEEVRAYNKSISDNNHSLLNNVNDIALKVTSLNEKIEIKNFLTQPNKVEAERSSIPIPQNVMNSILKTKA